MLKIFKTNVLTKDKRLEKNEPRLVLRLLKQRWCSYLFLDKYLHTCLLLDIDLVNISYSFFLPTQWKYSCWEVCDNRIKFFSIYFFFYIFLCRNSTFINNFNNASAPTLLFFPSAQTSYRIKMCDSFWFGELRFSCGQRY
jgi:hypothetical protein